MRGYQHPEVDHKTLVSYLWVPTSGGDQELGANQRTAPGVAHILCVCTSRGLVSRPPREGEQVQVVCAVHVCGSAVWADKGIALSLWWSV